MNMAKVNRQSVDNEKIKKLKLKMNESASGITNFKKDLKNSSTKNKQASTARI